MGKKKINKKNVAGTLGVFPLVETPSSKEDMTDVDSYIKRRKKLSGLNNGGMSKDRLTEKDREAADDAVKGRKYTIINDDGRLGNKKIVKRNNGGMVSDYIKDLL